MPARIIFFILRSIRSILFLLSKQMLGINTFDYISSYSTKSNKQSAEFVSEYMIQK